jgi:RNA polymerase sigma factor (sigma-70 family)
VPTHLWGMLGAQAISDDIASTVAEAAAGDVAALALIVAHHHEDMARVCAVICGDADIAEDAVQSAWPIAWRKLGALRDPARLRPWLVSIAANQARQAMRRERRRHVVELSIGGTGPVADPDQLLPMADLRVALGKLGADDRALLALRYVAELSSDEIGQALGISASGTRSRLERLLARLRRDLDDG